MPIVHSQSQQEPEKLEFVATPLNVASKLAELARNGLQVEEDKLQPPLSLDPADLNVSGWSLNFVDAVEVSGWGRYAKLLPSQSWFSVLTFLKAGGQFLVDVQIYQDQTKPQPITITCQPAFDNPEGPRGAQTVAVSLQPLDQQHATFVLRMGDAGQHSLMFSGDKEFNLVKVEITQIS